MMPAIPEKFYPAMVTSSLILIIIGISTYIKGNDIFMTAIGGGLIGFGFAAFIVFTKEWAIKDRIKIPYKTNPKIKL